MDRDTLLRETFPLVQRVAFSMARRLPPSVEIFDLTQAGFLGLLDAADKFDWGKGVRFSTYAELRVRGAILDSLRSLDWVPRSVRRRRRELMVAESRLESCLGRKPSEEELATSMKMSLHELRTAREQVHRAEMASDTVENIEDAVARLTDAGSPDPQELLERRDMERLLARAIEKLTQRERLLVELYYCEELTMKEVGRFLGVNESRVSQIHSKIIAKLKLRLRRDLRPRILLARTA